jgi:phage terminase small subunit
MARGKKPRLNHSPKMENSPPRGLPKEVNKCWVRLRERVSKASGVGVSAADLELLTMGAYQLARVEAMRNESLKTPFTQADDRGIERMHPLWGELRNAESQLRATFTTLMLTPRSRKTKAAHQEAVGAAPDDRSSNDPILKLLG